MIQELFHVSEMGHEPLVEDGGGRLQSSNQCEMGEDDSVLS